VSLFPFVHTSTKADHIMPYSYRMQRVLHSTLTARILLNLREAALRDRTKKALTIDIIATSFSIDEMNPPEAQTALSTVIMGVDTWILDTGSNAQD